MKEEHAKTAIPSMWTVFLGNKTHDIYFYNMASGELSRYTVYVSLTHT